MASKKDGKKPGAKEAETAILQWFECEGEPATVQSLTDALGSKYGKTLVQQVLEDCAGDKRLQLKDIKKARFYYLVPSVEAGGAGGDTNVTSGVDPAKAALVQQLKERVGCVAALTAEMDALRQRPNAAQRATNISALSNECAALRARLEVAQKEAGGEGRLSAAEVAHVAQRYKKARRFWLDRKQMAERVMDAVVGDSGDPKAVAEMFGLTTDQEANVSYADTNIPLPQVVDTA